MATDSDSITLDEVDIAVADAYAATWWLFLIGGILWLLLGFVILSLRPASISVTVILIAVAFWLGAFTMFALAFVSSGGWGIVGIALGAWAIGNPDRSTLLLITIIGVWTIFKGVFDLVAAFHYRGLKHQLA